jgi:hypothetical protein
VETPGGCYLGISFPVASRIQLVLSHLETLRVNCSYEEFKVHAEKAVLALLAGAPDGIWFNSFTQVPLWLAAHRLVKTGQVVGPNCGTFRAAA